jgi:ABC-2 type transport system ATP-binding protein
MGKTIMVSSHILPELADICNKVGIIERGELHYNDTVDELMKLVRQQTVLRISVVGDSAPAAALIEQASYVEKVEAHDGQLRVTLAAGEHDYSELSTVLIEAGHRLTRLTEEEINLETAFMTLTKGITS